MDRVVIPILNMPEFQKREKKFDKTEMDDINRHLRRGFYIIRKHWLKDDFNLLGSLEYQKHYSKILCDGIIAGLNHKRREWEEIFQTEMNVRNIEKVFTKLLITILANYTHVYDKIIDTMYVELGEMLRSMYFTRHWRDQRKRKNKKKVQQQNSPTKQMKLEDEGT